MTERSIPRESGETRVPFIIRAHHLSNFFPVVTGLTPAEEASRLRKTIDGPRRYSKLHPLGIIYRLVSSKKYARDVLGDTPEQAERVEESDRKFFEDFLSLPDEYPVKLVTDQKDRICDACTIGEHCTQKPSKLIEVFRGDDAGTLRRFRKGARKLGLEEDLEVVREMATYSNAPAREVESILTTASTIKSVLMWPSFI